MARLLSYWALFFRDHSSQSVESARPLIQGSPLTVIVGWRPARAVGRERSAQRHVFDACGPRGSVAPWPSTTSSGSDGQ